ncbi:MAG TPA: crossover junction endodeoxyribonuclease RuvC [Candidatus Binatia bacterium]|nr:crossover junction endodeoxyribonuclease RuvC [Candidatus Binatia bacterium]
MRVLGIDPGSRLTGWGVVEARGLAFRHVASGTIDLTPGDPLGQRLARLHAACARLVAEWEPAAVVLERAFVARNVQSAFRLGEARGAVLAAAGANGIALHEYAPATVKLATVGHGRADKRAIARGIALRLGLDRSPAPDAADALAIALCHLQQAPLLARTAIALRTGVGGGPRERGA